MKKLILSIAAVMAMMSAKAQVPGDLDMTFGNSGYAMPDFFQNTSEGWWDMCVLANDKIVQVGYSYDGADADVLVAKFKEDGSVDSTFAVNGVLKIDLSLGLNEEARGVFELPDGKLLITGYVHDALNSVYNGFVMRLNADGTVDDTFGTTASGRTEFNAGDNTIAYGRSVISDGNEIYVGATAEDNAQMDMFVFNFTLGGALDNSFASNGYAQVDISGADNFFMSMDLTSNGSFVLVGNTESGNGQLGSVTVLTQFGTPTTFGNQMIDFGNGLNTAEAVYVDDNNYIYVAGGEGNSPDMNGFIMRYKNDGSGDLDDTYATAGVMESDPGVTTDLIFRNILPVWDGGVVVTGELSGAITQLYAMMLESDGTLQNAFQGGDVYVPYVINVTSHFALGGGVQSDGSIIIGGLLESQDFVGQNMFMVRLAPYVDNSGITELTNMSLNVYPNPATSVFSIDMEDVQSVVLISMQGTVVASWDPTTTGYQIPASIVPGSYILRATSTEVTATAPLIIR